jgi:N4-(beta-N-acetylglucosaminyl)-L-asparaginase
MTKDLSRRSFLAAGAAGLAGCALPTGTAARAAAPAVAPDGQDGTVVAIASGNGVRTVAEARRLCLEEKLRPVSAAVRGVGIVEADPSDQSVGLGGLPNEDGIVTLDASCMDGPTHNAGSVGHVEDIVHVAQVAELVMDRTDHVNLVGAGAKAFALEHGFEETELLTEASREWWLRWRATREEDDRLWPLNGMDPNAPNLQDQEKLWGTIHCSVLAQNGDLGCCTTTSGLAGKIPGRIGDSPLVGCGMYCDNEVGSAGATGRGEAAILSGGSWLIVERMRAGDKPEEACLHALMRVARQAERAARWQPALWRDGQPNFGLTFYAVRKDGLYGSATMRGIPGGPKFAVADAAGARHEECAILYGRG